MRKSLLIVFLLAWAGIVQAQEVRDSMRVYYRTGYRTVDTTFCDNRHELSHFIQSIKDAMERGELERVIIRSCASPDGTNAANERLAARRADSLQAYIQRHTGIPDSMIEKCSEGIAWSMLREMVAESEMQYRDEVLVILDNTPLWVYDDAGKIISGKKKELMDLKGGVPYRYMYEHFFPEMRSSLSATLYARKAEEPQPQKPAEEPKDTVPALVVTPPTTVAETPAEEMPEPAPEEEKPFRPLLAVKTNVLYWAGLMPDFRNYSFIPNLELEYFFLDRWSVAAAGNYAKWDYSGDDWFGISTWSVEPRWWIWGDGKYRWIYLGLYGEVGDYDVQNNRIAIDGYTGKLWSTGLSVGAALPFTKRWGAEVGLRAGYRHAQEKAYSYEAPDYFLDAKDTGNHWGVTGIKASIYYRFGKGNK